MPAYRVASPARTAEGYFVRTIGKAYTKSGQLRPKKFTLGRDSRHAERANLRLQQLWEDIERYHTERLKSDEPPHWNVMTLEFAEAIRRGERIRPSTTAGPNDPEIRPLESVEFLKDAFPSIADLLDTEHVPGMDRARQSATEQARFYSGVAQSLAEMADRPAAAAGSDSSTHQGIDACAEQIRQTKIKEGQLTEWGRKQAENVERLKPSIPDVPLAQLDYDTLEKAKHYWTARPKSRKSGKPISLDTVRAQMKALRTLVRFLHRSSQYRWTQPSGLEDALKVNYEALRTSQELASLKDGVPVFSVDELTTLYAYARDGERVLMLLGLNCGFSHAEILSLRQDELDLSAGTIKRIRQKTGVYGEWSLWDETIRAIRWWQKHQPNRKKQPFALLNSAGNPLTRQQIANRWNGLIGRIQKDQPAFRQLPFKYLRKTAGQLVRQVSDGETMAVFHARGQSVSSDDQADRYANRLFNRVAQATDNMGRQLQPMIDAAEASSPSTPFTGSKQGGGRSLPPAKIQSIRQLAAEGGNTRDIARAVGVSRDTVARYVPAQSKRA